MKNLFVVLMVFSSIVACKKNNDENKESIREETVVRDPYSYYGQQPNMYGPNYGYNDCIGSYCPPGVNGNPGLPPNYQPQPINNCNPYMNNGFDLPQQNNLWGMYGSTFQQMGCVQYQGANYNSLEFYQYLLLQYQATCSSATCYNPYQFYNWCNSNYTDLSFNWGSNYYPVWPVYGQFYGAGSNGGYGGNVGYYQNGNGGWGFNLNFMKGNSW